MKDGEQDFDSQPPMGMQYNSHTGFANNIASTIGLTIAEISFYKPVGDVMVFH